MIGLCLAACGLDDEQTARQFLREILELSKTHQWLSIYAIALPFATILADNADQPERAATLLGLAHHHPLSPKGWLNCWPLLARLQAELQSGLGPELFETAWARGATLDLEATAKTLLTELSSHS